MNFFAHREDLLEKIHSLKLNAVSLLLKYGMESARELNKIVILKHNRNNGQLTKIKNSNWYFQAQGQL